MTKNVFPDDPSAVIGLLADVFRYQGKTEIVGVLESAVPTVEQTDYDNWNGGTYYYTMALHVPRRLFASIEPRIKELEDAIMSKFASVLRDTGNQQLQSVLIVPNTDGLPVHPPSTAADDEIKRIWGTPPFRLFISHVAVQKQPATDLKTFFEVFGISGFVAHEDIEPGREWQGEIEKALTSMHALTALLTPEFHGSSWTDQEIGIALGKRMLVIPVRLGLDPYGFIGKHQGISGRIEDMKGVAAEIVSLLMREPGTKDKMREALVYGFENSNSYANSKSVLQRIEMLESLTGDQLERLEGACVANRQVKESFGVPERVNALKQRFAGVPF